MSDLLSNVQKHISSNGTLSNSKTFTSIEDEKKIGICTDSKYVINCVKGYGDRMESKNWLDYIPNKELVKNGLKEGCIFIRKMKDTNLNVDTWLGMVS